jgi:transposase
MFLPEPNVQIWLYAQPTDMRKSFNGLCALVASKLKNNPVSGDFFVFINRRKTHIKILYFDGSGF